MGGYTVEEGRRLGEVKNGVRIKDMKVGVNDMDLQSRKHVPWRDMILH